MPNSTLSMVRTDPTSQPGNVSGGWICRLGLERLGSAVWEHPDISPRAQTGMPAAELRHTAAGAHPHNAPWAHTHTFLWVHLRQKNEKIN